MSLIVSVDYDPTRPAHLRKARYYPHEARPDRIPVGASWPSVTTICDLLGKVWMAPWAARRMYDEIEGKAKANAAGIWTTAEALEVAHEAKGAWRRTRDTAAQKGTDLHEVFEMICRGECLSPLKDQLLDAEYAWGCRVKEWLREQQITAESWERAIAHPYGGGFAGRYDAVVRMAGRKRPGLLDLKTGKNIPTHVGQQLAAYAEALKLDGVSVGWAMVLHAPALEVKPADTNFSLIERANKMKITATTYTLGQLREHWRAFQALRHVWTWHEKYGGE